MEVGVQEPVVEIKRKIEQLLGVTIASQTLSVSGIELLDGLDMEDYPIVTQGTKIDLTINSYNIGFAEPLLQCHYSCKIQIIIKSSATQHHIEVDRLTETVGSLKEKIHIIDGIPIKRMSLFFCGIEMVEDFRSLSEYGICEFSEIFVLLKNMNRLRGTGGDHHHHDHDQEPARLSVVVQTPSTLLNGASIPMEMRVSSTVSELRQSLLSMKYLPMDDYLFIHKQRIMRDNRSLMWHGVEDGETLYVFKGIVIRSEICD
ncbi:hypothetical protein FNV43_RR13409 [Rhamnella rubrinervis]|uniref:Ubiquitin-like domain-containing protein n=1 Tax=Rhamnella rubrinervis TaxID=2594499 RepID=A0A8K0ME65_9ROSA|nr:hypothetical protein FNV43_RR13409 [Rhamnella rubrinervis]